MSKTQFTPLIRALLLAAACTSTPAWAQDKFVELQLDETDLVAFLRAEVMQEVSSRCSTGAGVPDLACWGEPCLLDRIDVLGGGFFRKPGGTHSVQLDNLGPFNVPLLEYVQPVRAFFKTEACADDPQCSVTDYAREQNMELIVDLRLSDGQLCANPKSVDTGFGSIPLGGGSCLPLNLSAATRIVGPSLERRASGMAADLSGTRPRIAVRIEYVSDEYDSLPLMVRQTLDRSRATAWRTFFGGQIAPTSAPSTHEWRIFLSKGLLESATVARFRQILMDEQDVTADGPVIARWLSSGLLTTDLTVEVDTPCPHTIETDISAAFLLSVEEGDVIMNGTVSWNPDDADVAACGAIFGGFVFSPFTIPAAAVFASSFSDPEQFETSQCSATEGEDGVNMRCRLPMDIIEFNHWTSYLRLTPAGGRATSDGFTISGTSIGGGVELTGGAAGGNAAVSYGVSGSCAEGPSAGFTATAVVQGPHVCDLAVRNDPRRVYEIIGTNTTETAGVRTTIELDFPSMRSILCDNGDGTWSACPEGQAPLDRFWEAPYPLHIRARTTRGTFSFASNTPVKPTQAEQDAAFNAAIRAVGLCHMEETGLFGIPGLWDPRWEVDPPYDAILWERIRGRVRDVDVGRVHIESIRMSPVDALIDRLGVLRTRSVALTSKINLRITSGGRTYRTTVTVPISVDWNVTTSLLGRVSSLSSKNAISVPVSLGSVVNNTLFQLELPARSIRLR